MKTFDDARSDSTKVWIKNARGASDAIGPYELRRFELNCGARQIRTLSVANYDASGDIVGSREGGRWASILPDTVGETIYTGACRGQLGRTCQTRRSTATHGYEPTRRGRDGGVRQKRRREQERD